MEAQDHRSMGGSGYLETQMGGRIKYNNSYKGCRNYVVYDLPF